MAISYIGSESTVGTSVAIPTHQAGDLLLFNSFRDGSNSTPTKPGDITQLDTNTTNSAGALSGYKIAASSGETSGTWSNATEVSVMVFRDVDQTTPVGDHVDATGSSTTISFPALTMTVGDGTSWVAGMAYHRSTNCDLSVNPTGMSLRLNEQNGADEVGLYDTNGGVSSWSLQTTSVGGRSSGWYGTTVEIIAAASGISVTPDTASLTLSTFAPTVTATANQFVTPTTASLTLSTFAPTVTASDHQSVTPTTASLTLTTFAPTVNVGNNQTVTPDTASLTLTTFEPTVTATANQFVTPTTASLSLTTFAPTVTAGNHISVTPITATLTLTTFIPTVAATANQAVTPTTATLTLTTFAPTVATGTPVVEPSPITTPITVTEGDPILALVSQELPIQATAEQVVTAIRITKSNTVVTVKRSGTINL